jgi:hypothetical protein
MRTALTLVVRLHRGSWEVEVIAPREPCGGARVHACRQQELRRIAMARLGLV